MSSETDEPRTIKTANTVFDIIELLHEYESAGLGLLADEMEMSKSTIKYHLNSMLNREYVTREGDKYSLSLKFLKFGILARQRMDIYDIAHPELKRLADETNATSWLLVEEHGRSVHLAKVEGEHAAPSRAEVGERTHLHDHSAGKLFLAYLDEHRVEEIIETHGLPKRTGNTITDQEKLFRELETIREQGYAVNDNEYTEGLRAVSAPILHDGEILGAIGLSDASHRMRGERFRTELPDIVMGAADSIMLSLKYG